MLATVGAGQVWVFRRPRIAVLSTGDELVPAGARPAGGQVPDSNAPALAAALARDGAVAVPLGVAPDRREELVARVARGLAADALICTGGSSVGAEDYVQPVLADALGVPPLFSGIAVRPGRPTAVFVGGRGWAAALPGHAVSALVVYELLLRDAVRRWGGETRVPPRGQVQVRLDAPVRAPADRELVARVRLEAGHALPLAGASATIGNLSGADGLVRCPAGGELAAGAMVTALLLQ
jgi:molybdopterin molybdotransferase